MSKPVQATSWKRRVAPILFLLVFAAVCAEYLIGYDDIIGNPAALIFGLFIFVPLYGVPALIIREITRRIGRGWPTILLLALAFGLIEAGLVDQSLFNPDYRGIPYWESLRDPTFIPALGMSAIMILQFLGGHVFGSVASPIAFSEALVPNRRLSPWLKTRGLIVAFVFWLAAALFVVYDQLQSDSFHISLTQAAVTGLVVIALVTLALTRKPKKASRKTKTAITTPRPLVVGTITFVLLGMRPFQAALASRGVIPNGWLSALVILSALAVWLILVARWSRGPSWGHNHIFGAAAGCLLSIGGSAFIVQPLGSVPLGDKLIINTVLFLLVVGLIVLVVQRQRRTA